MTTFDLDQHVAQWRRELEATLAFSPSELDELEDHLRSSHESRLNRSDSPEAAWTYARADLGSASALALEFAKDKLLPALGRLLLAWWKLGVLLVLYVLTLRTLVNDMEQAEMPIAIGPLFQFSWGRADLWILILLALSFTVAFLPTRAQRVGLLAGLGNAICLLPWLHLAVYNRAVESMTCSTWSLMWGSFGIGQLALATVGLVGINTWARLRTNREERRTALAVAATPLFFIAFAPFLDGVIGNLAAGGLFRMPDPHAVTLQGTALIQYCGWWFNRPLYEALVLGTAWLPVLTVLLACVGAILLEGLARIMGATKRLPARVFPAASDVAWILALAALGICWVLAHELEPALDSQLTNLQAYLFYRGNPHGGVEVLVVCHMLLYFSCALYLTRRLKRTAQVRPFYATTIVLIEIGVLVWLIALPLIDREMLIDPTFVRRGFEPTWLTWLSSALVLVFAARHAQLIRRKAGSAAVSLWRFKASSLVEFGCLAGVICAWATQLLVSGSLILASDSVVSISAMLDWGNAVRNHSVPFDPRKYLHPPLFDWSVAGPDLLCLGLTAGFTLAFILSALEFIRFNAFRLYRMRKLRSVQPVTAAFNV